MILKSQIELFITQVPFQWIVLPTSESDKSEHNSDLFLSLWVKWASKNHRKMHHFIRLNLIDSTAFQNPYLLLSRTYYTYVRTKDYQGKS